MAKLIERGRSSCKDFTQKMALGDVRRARFFKKWTRWPGPLARLLLHGIYFFLYTKKNMSVTCNKIGYTFCLDAIIYYSMQIKSSKQPIKGLTRQRALIRAP